MYYWISSVIEHEFMITINHDICQEKTSQNITDSLRGVANPCSGNDLAGRKNIDYCSSPYIPLPRIDLAHECFYICRRHGATGRKDDVRLLVGGRMPAAMIQRIDAISPQVFEDGDTTRIDFDCRAPLAGHPYRARQFHLIVLVAHLRAFYFLLATDYWS